MKQIEAQAVISAADKTGAVFESIAGKVRNLQSAMKSLGNVSAGSGSVVSSFGKLDTMSKKLTHAIGGTIAAQKAIQGLHKVIETYAEYDEIVRKMRPLADMTVEEQKPFVNQAIRLGGSTPYNDLQVLHAQLDLIQRGVNKDFVQPIVEIATDYASAMGTELPESAKTIEGILFSTRKHIEDGNEALKVTKRTVDMAVKLAKIGGLDNEDIRDYFRFAGGSGATAGLSDETMGTMAALMRRANIRGSESGVATRAIAGALVAPTHKGLSALTALGIDYNQFIKMPNALSVDRLGLLVQRTFGKNLSEGMRSQLAAVLQNTEIVGNREEFIDKTSGILGGLFGKGKNGQLKAQDAREISKAVGEFYKLGAQSVDSEGLLRAIMAAHPSLALANALFGVKQGSRALAVMNDPDKFNEFYTKLKEAPEGFAHHIAEERMAGFFGAVQRSEGALMNLWTALGRANDPALTAGFDQMARFFQSIAQLDSATLRYISYLGASVTALIAFNAALKAGQIVNTLAGGGVVAGEGTAVAAGAGTLAALTRLAGPVAALIATLYPQPAGESDEEELARRQKEMPAELVKQWKGTQGVPYTSGPFGGEAKITIDVRAPDWLSALVTMRGRIGGLAIGTTGSTGKSMPEAAASGGRGW